GYALRHREAIPSEGLIVAHYCKALHSVICGVSVVKPFYCAVAKPDYGAADEPDDSGADEAGWEWTRIYGSWCYSRCARRSFPVRACPDRCIQYRRLPRASACRAPP